MSVPEWVLPPVEPFEWAQPSSPPPGDPDIGHVRDHSVVEQGIHTGIDVAHYVGTAGEITAMFASEGTMLLAAAEVAAPLGAVAVVAVSGMEFYRATTTSARIEGQKGFAYGLMWGVLGLPDLDETTPGWNDVGTGSVGPSPESDYEHKWWAEGVREGREKAKDPKVRDEIVRALAYEMVAQRKDLDTDPQHRAWSVAVDRTLNRIWEGVREDVAPVRGTHLKWLGEGDGFPQDTAEQGRGLPATGAK